MGKYDSTIDTNEHRFIVLGILSKINDEILDRALNHDSSKLESPEKECFDKYTPLLKNTTYGSDEYKKYLKEMTDMGLKHH